MQVSAEKGEMGEVEVNEITPLYSTTNVSFSLLCISVYIYIDR